MITCSYTIITVLCLTCRKSARQAFSSVTGRKENYNFVKQSRRYRRCFFLCFVGTDSCWGAISVLCCSEFAHQVEELVIIGENVELSIPFCVTAWTWSTAEFQQKIAWEGNEGFVTEQGVRVSPLPGHFFTKKYSFPERIAVKSIKLPYCPNIHIFGITVHG